MESQSERRDGTIDQLVAQFERDAAKSEVPMIGKSRNALDVLPAQ